MVRLIAGACLAAAIGVLVGACSGDDSSGGYGYVSGPNAQCQTYTTCGSCTPALGCGWCYAGHGACLSDPSMCSGASTDWTWNPSGCHDFAADPSVNPQQPQQDAGTGNDATQSDASAADSSDAPASSDTGSGSDTSTDAPASDAPASDGPSDGPSASSG
jgi:hypothetical protein